MIEGDVLEQLAVAVVGRSSGVPNPARSLPIGSEKSYSDSASNDGTGSDQLSCSSLERQILRFEESHRRAGDESPALDWNMHKYQEQKAMSLLPVLPWVTGLINGAAAAASTGLDVQAPEPGQEDDNEVEHPELTAEGDEGETAVKFLFPEDEDSVGKIASSVRRRGNGWHGHGYQHLHHVSKYRPLSSPASVGTMPTVASSDDNDTFDEEEEEDEHRRERRDRCADSEFMVHMDDPDDVVLARTLVRESSSFCSGTTAEETEEGECEFDEETFGSGQTSVNSVGADNSDGIDSDCDRHKEKNIVEINDSACSDDLPDAAVSFDRGPDPSRIKDFVPRTGVRNNSTAATVREDEHLVRNDIMAARHGNIQRSDGSKKAFSLGEVESGDDVDITVKSCDLNAGADLAEAGGIDRGMMVRTVCQGSFTIGNLELLLDEDFSKGNKKNEETSSADGTFKGLDEMTAKDLSTILEHEEFSIDDEDNDEAVRVSEEGDPLIDVLQLKDLAADFVKEDITENINESFHTADDDDDDSVMLAVIQENMFESTEQGEIVDRPQRKQNDETVGFEQEDGQGHTNVMKTSEQDYPAEENDSVVRGTDASVESEGHVVEKTKRRSKKFSFLRKNSLDSASTGDEYPKEKKGRFNASGSQAGKNYCASDNDDFDSGDTDVSVDGELQIMKSVKKPSSKKKFPSFRSLDSTNSVDVGSDFRRDVRLSCAQVTDGRGINPSERVQKGNVYVAGLVTTELSQHIAHRNWEQAERRCLSVPDEAGTRVSFKGCRGLPLHLACLNKPPLSTVSVLLESYPPGAKEKEMTWNQLPLHFACMSGATADVINHLVECYPLALKMREGFGGYLPLHIACHKNATVEVIRALFEHFPSAVNVEDMFGDTPEEIVSKGCGIIPDKRDELLDVFCSGEVKSQIVPVREIDNFRVSDGRVNFKICGLDLKRRKKFGFIKKLPSTFFVLAVKDTFKFGQWRVEYRSTPTMKNRCPTWKDDGLDLELLCDGKFTRPLKVSVYKFSKRGAHSLMGSFECTLDDLIKAKCERADNEFDMKKKGFKLRLGKKEKGYVTIIAVTDK